MTHRRFNLQRDEDETGVSGTGVVAEGVWWPDGDVAVLRWTSAWPTSVVFHDRGLDSVEAIHGHGGKTRIVWIDPERPGCALPSDSLPPLPDPERDCRCDFCGTIHEGAVVDGTKPSYLTCCDARRGIEHYRRQRDEARAALRALEDDDG